ILPLTLSYDALQRGRLHAIVHVGTPLHAYAADDRGAFDSMLETQIRRRYPFNASHLISRFLVAGPEAFTTANFGRWLAHARERLATAGLMLDPRLAASPIDTLATQRLAWLQRAGLIAHTNRGWRNDWPAATPPSWRSPAAIVRYCDNALEDYQQALAPGLMLQP